MGLADEIIKNKKKKESVADQIINGTYTSQNSNNSTKKKEEKKWYDEYFKESQGNGWQTIGYSALDALGNLTEGSLRAFEGISDWGRNRGADIVDFFGADDYAKKLRERSKEDDTTAIVDAWNHITAGDLAGTKSEEEIGHFKKVEENSIFGEKGDQVFQGVGNSLTSIGVGALSGGTLATPSFVISAAGNAETEALNNGATAGEARMYGLISGAIEYGTEKMFGGLGKTSEKFGLGKGQLDDQAVKLFTKNMKSSLMKNITTLGIKSVGEGLEEVASGIGNAFAQKITYMNEEEIGQLLKDQNLMDSFVSGMLSSALMQSPSTITSTVQGRDVNTGLTKTQQQYVNEIAQQRMVEAQRRNAKLNGYEKGKIEDRALTDFQKGRLADASKLQQVNLPGLSNKDMDLQQSAYKYGINPNSEAIVTIDTMLKNRDVIGKFDEDLFKGSNENSLWSRKNGVRYVVFNPNASADVLLEELAIHELTHDLMSSENSQEIIDNQKIMDYVSTLDGYEEERAKVEKLYAEQTKKLKTKEEKTAYIDEEIVANTLGKNIGSQEYIRRLIDDEPSIAKNIYDWVVNKVANKNGVKNEKAYWNNVKNNFEKAYNMEWEGKGSENDTRFAIANTEFANLTPNQQNRLDKAEKLRKEGKSSDEIWYKTGFEYKDSNNSYDFHVEDLKFKKTLNVKTGQAYKIEDVLEGELLDTYPFLKNKEIIMDDMVQDALRDGQANAEYLKQLKGIKGATTNDGKLVLNTGNLKTTKEATNVLSHEIQHLIQEYQENGSEETVYFGIDENGNYYTKGVSEKEALAAYRNHKNEIEAEVTRVQNAMTKEQRHRYSLSLLINEVSKHYSTTSSSIKTDKFISNLDKKYGQLLDEWYDNNRTDGNYDIERNSKANSANTTRNESERKSRNKVVGLHEQGRGSKDFTNLYVEHSESNMGENNNESNRNTRTQELDNSSFFVDSEGRTLTKEQQEFFKDSKVRDENGNLKVMYHGTDANFNVFEIRSGKRNIGGLVEYEANAKGFFFSDSEDFARDYGNNIKEVYVNLTNPLFSPDKTYSDSELSDIRYIIQPLVEADVKNGDLEIVNYPDGSIMYKSQSLYRSPETIWESYASKETGIDWEHIDSDAFNEVINRMKEKGYDGTFVDELQTDGEGNSISSVYVLNSNQIKNVDNTNPTDDADIRYSQQTEGWQSFLDKNFEAKGTKTRLGDIKLPGLTNTIQEEVQKQTSNALLPIANELKELNKNLTKVMNPAEIAQLTPQDANTTPILPGINRNQVGDGKSKFFDNINNKVNMLNDEQKTAILNSEDVKYYDKVTNKDSLDKAFERLQNGGATETLRWHKLANRDENGQPIHSISATDIAEGWILLKQYADNGDTENMVEVAKTLRNMGTMAGQTVQAFNILSRLTPEGMVKYAQSELLEAYDKMVKNKSREWIEQHREDFDLQPNEVAFIMDTMQEVSQMEDGYDKRVKLAEIQKLMTDKLPPTKGAGLKAWMRISMLFNPKTQIRNIAGNAVIAPVNYFGDLFASGVDKLISQKTGVRTTGTTKLSNYAKGFKTGLYQSYNDFKKGINTRNIEGNRFEVTEGKSFNDNNPIGKALNRVDSLLSFMLDAGDRGFYEASFVNSINNQMVLNNTTEVTQEMIDIATQEALSRTWQDNNTYSKAVLGIRKLLNLGQTYGIGDVLIPFAKTPANLTKAIVDYSPAGLVNVLVKGNNLRKSLNNGQFNAKMQHEFVQSLGKATAGTMLYVLGYALAQAGITSGASDEDKDVSNFMKNTLGISSYSIKIGDKSFTYDWAQPIAAPLTITANVVNAQKEDKEQALTEAIIGSLDSAGSTLLEQSFLQSINDVLNNQDGVISGLITEMLELPARAIPTLSKQIVDLTDSTQRQTFEYNKPIKSAYNYAISKIPGLSYTLDPSVDTLGREIQKYGGKNNLFNVFLNPANVNTGKFSKSGEEIYRLYKETGETNIMPRVAPYYVNKKGEKIILTTQQRTQYQKVSGAIIEENVANLLGSTAYQNMSDTKKAETINDIVNYSYNIAQNQVLGTELSDTYQTAYEYAQIGDISDFYEFRNSIDDTDADTKRTSIVNYLYNSDLEDNQIANLYGNYYSSDKKINAMLELRIPMREFIKFNSADIQGQYNTNTGQTISGSKKNATIEYVNTLNLSKAQRAILVKSVYSSYKNNDNDIVRYVNTLPGTANEKKVLLKSIGFDAYDDDVFNYINSQNISKDEKLKKLKELGFTVRDGRVYY